MYMTGVVTRRITCTYHIGWCRIVGFILFIHIIFLPLHCCYALALSLNLQTTLYLFCVHENKCLYTPLSIPFSFNHTTISYHFWSGYTRSRIPYSSDVFPANVLMLSSYELIIFYFTQLLRNKLMYDRKSCSLLSSLTF